MHSTTASEQMIEQQVRCAGVLDARVLGTLRAVPRELFVPPPQRYRAYADVEVPLPCGQHMLRPSMAGQVLQALAPWPGEPVLEIGAGTGFLTACLRAMAGAVRSLELFPELAQLARGNLAACGMRDVEVIDADARSGDDGERYAAIAVTASLPSYDERFQRMLAPGGRLFVVVGAPPLMEARLVRRISEDAWTVASLFETILDPLVNAFRPPAFTF
jgi:protein-L-isoaspartate(D-aspartate) O-methyltransferase